MSYTAQLLELFEKQDGLIMTRDVETAGIPRHYLTILARQGLVERVSHGVYLSPEAFEDEMFMMQARNRQLIFSHETALYLNDLTDRDLINYSVTVPTGYHNRLLTENGVKVYSVKKEWHAIGQSETVTAYGRPILFYDAERTLCDMFKKRNKVDPDLLNDSMKRYLQRDDKNIPKLLRYAEQLRVSSPIRKYVEILL